MVKKLGLLLCASAALVSWNAVPPLAFAQKYQVLDTDQLILSREERSLASDFNRGKVAASPQAQDALKKQVVYLVSKLTQPNEVANYTQHRKNIGLILAERNQTPEARKTVVDTLAAYGNGIATRSSFSPAARINAVAILAELDEKSENLRDRLPPLPSRAAFGPLKTLAAAADTPAYVRAVALHGLERQARVYWRTNVWDDATRDEVLKIAMGIVAAQPLTEMDRQSQAWLARRAYDILAVAQTPLAVDAALSHLSETTTLPSLRLSALSYLSALDFSKQPVEKQSQYLVGVAHLIRSQLVQWYEFEEDVIKRDTNATAAGGGYGGMGGDYGSMMGGGMMGGGMVGGEGGGADYDMGGDYGAMMGGRGGDGGYGSGEKASKPKPIDTQDWKTRSARRLLNQISQTVHVALDGKPLSSQNSAVTSTPLTAPGLNADLVPSVNQLVTLVDDFQTAVNDPDKITDINSLLNEAKLPIEEIMDFAIKLPGFTTRYPELADDAESLETVPEAPKPVEGQGDQPPAAAGSGDALPGEVGAEPATNNATGPGANADPGAAGQR